MAFPNIRMRRLRKSVAFRRLVSETTVTVNGLVYPLFVRKGKGLKEPIESMTDCYHFSPDTIVKEAQEVAKLGIPAVLLFGLPGEAQAKSGLPSKKDKTGSEAWAEDGAVQSAVRQIKDAVGELIVITDVCLCAYTSTGHCGLIKDGKVDNDATCELLAKVAPDRLGFSLRCNISFASQRTTIAVLLGGPSPDLFIAMMRYSSSVFSGCSTNVASVSIAVATFCHSDLIVRLLPIASSRSLGLLKNSRSHQ